MPTEISGSTGVNKIQDDTVVAADIASSVYLGKVLAVTEFNNTSVVTFSTTSDVTGYTMSYTRPTGVVSTNKLLLHLDMITGHNNSNSTSHNVSLYDGSTVISSYNNFSLLDGSTNNPNRLTQHSAIHKLYSPSSTSNITFYIKGNYGGGGGGGDTTFEIKNCRLTVMELSY